MDQPTRLFDFIYYQAQQYPMDNSISVKRNGAWESFSTQQVIDSATEISSGLLELGLAPGDKVANVSNNRPEWNMVDIGVLQMGGIHVPLYPTITDEDYLYIFNHAEVKAVFVSSLELLSRIQKVAQDVPTLKHIFVYDDIKGAQHWTEVRNLGKGKDHKRVQSIMNSIEPSALATMIYTSGTTGFPKGVMLSHNNIASNVRSVKPILPLYPGDKALSFLPLCHIFERMLTYTYMMYGAQIWYAESLETIGDNLKEVKPNLFSTVPRLLEKVYDKIVSKGMELTGIKKKLFFWAVGLGLKYDPNKNMGIFYNQQLKLANKLIFSKWREALGGNVRCIVTGAAALQPRLGRVFWAAQIPVLEGYGLTETSPAVAVNDLPGMRVGVGTVGPIIPGVEVKIASDGEICVKGELIMMGYYKDPEKTAEVIDSEGFFHTGDIGEFTDKGLLKITDRKKEMFKTSGGKYIAPQQIENKLKESIFIEQAIVIGENEKFPAALITPSWIALEEWCKNNNCLGTREELVKNAKVIELYTQAVNTSNEHLGQWEKIKKFELLPVEWSIETRELTPTLKLKRKVIMEKYGRYCENIYTKV